MGVLAKGACRNASEALPFSETEAALIGRRLYTEKSIVHYGKYIKIPAVLGEADRYVRAG
jgi:hypothetical protein